MGQARSPKNVLLITAISSHFQEVFSWAVSQLEERFGPVWLADEIFLFDHTSFYQKTMGDQIRKQLIAFDRLVDPGELAQVKTFTNSLEEAYMESHEHVWERSINLDPGYITEAKLVLATVKNRDHRIYLGHGIYAEVTLSYYDKKWNGSRWTYPDYLTDQNLQFFTKCRNRLREKLAKQAFGD